MGWAVGCLGPAVEGPIVLAVGIARQGHVGRRKNQCVDSQNAAEQRQKSQASAGLAHPCHEWRPSPGRGAFLLCRHPLPLGMAGKLRGAAACAFGIQCAEAPKRRSIAKFQLLSLHEHPRHPMAPSGIEWLRPDPVRIQISLDREVASAGSADLFVHPGPCAIPIDQADCQNQGEQQQNQGSHDEQYNAQRKRLAGRGSHGLELGGCGRRRGGRWHCATMLRR